jgi:hypothetical protein
MTEETTTVKVPRHLHARVKSEAALQQRTLYEVIVEALELWLKIQEEKESD